MITRARPASTRAARRAPGQRPAKAGTPNENDTILRIEGREVSVSRLNKVFYPETGFTKGQVIDYYIRISPFLLPHLRDRPLTLKRYPDGVAGGFFYEK